MQLARFTNINHLLCSLSGHKFKLVKNITKHIKYYQCNNCGCEVSTNSKGELVCLTDELKGIHSGIKTVIVKRKMRKQHPQKAVA